VDRSNIITTATGAVALAVAAPVIVSMVSLINFAWPVIPILTVSSIFLSVNYKDSDKKTNNNKHDKNNTSA
jgi:hypothetical protein